MQTPITPRSGGRPGVRVFLLMLIQLISVYVTPIFMAHHTFMPATVKGAGDSRMSKTQKASQTQEDLLAGATAEKRTRGRQRGAAR